MKKIPFALRLTILASLIVVIITAESGLYYFYSRETKDVDRTLTLSLLNAISHESTHDFSVIENKNFQPDALTNTTKRISDNWNAYYQYVAYFTEPEKELADKFYADRARWLASISGRLKTAESTTTLYNQAFNIDLKSLIDLQQELYYEQEGKIEKLNILFSGLFWSGLLLIFGSLGFYLTQRLDETSPFKIDSSLFFQNEKPLPHRIFAVAFSIILVFVVYSEIQRRNELKHTLKSYGIEYSSEISRRFSHIFSSIYALSNVVQHSNGNVSIFRHFAQELFNIYPHIKAFNLAPHGIINAVMPQVDESLVIGLNVMMRKEEAAQTALAKKTGKLTLTEPIELFEGGQAIVSYLPIFLEDSPKESAFWGFSLMLIKFPEIFETPILFDRSFAEQFDYQVWQTSIIDGQKQAIYGKELPLERNDIQHFTIDLPNVVWTLSITPKQNVQSEILIRKLLASFLVASLVTFFAKKTIEIKMLENQKIATNIKQSIIDDICLILEIDLEGKILNVSKNFCELSGYSTQELTEQNNKLSCLLNPEYHSPEWFDSFIASINSGEKWTGTFCNVTKNDTLFWLQAVILPVINPQNKKIEKFVSVMFDETETINSAEEKRKLQHQLLQIQKVESIGQLASGVAHDFNNILMPILGFARVGKRAIDSQDTQRISDCFDRIETSANRAAKLVDKILVFCREKNFTPKVDPISATQLIEELFEIYQMIRASVSKTISIQLENSLPHQNFSILIQPIELHQLITNLIVNARDAIEDFLSENQENWIHEGGEIHIHLYTQKFTKIDNIECAISHQTVEGNYVIIAVSDTGGGIYPEKINRIFDPFFTTKEVGKGTGLGLSVVSGIVKNLGGKIVIDSKLNYGTTISLLFPKIEQP